MTIDPTWFELADIRRKRYEAAAWVPLHATVTEKSGEFAQVGYTETSFCIGTALIPVDELNASRKLGWSEIGLNEQRSHAFEDGERYKPAYRFLDNDESDLGEHLVMVHRVGSGKDQWFINPDLIIALGLVQEGEEWVRPEEGFVSVMKIRHNAEDQPNEILIKAEFLKDYLAARNMALRITGFWSRRATMANADALPWAESGTEENAADERFVKRAWEINKGTGDPYGAGFAVLQLGRNDVDHTDDHPVMGPATDSNTDAQSWQGVRRGEKLVTADGELWRNEWIMPAEHSIRVRQDKIPSTAYFATDVDGSTTNADDLNDEDIGQWLWFKPEILAQLIERRGFSISWHSAETGTINTPVGYSIHFGINQIDLVNVYAYDIARLPEWLKKIWAGYNLAPEGGLSVDFHRSQVLGNYPETKSPEKELGKNLNKLCESFKARWGLDLINEHRDLVSIKKRIHRLRSLSENGLLALAKDIARITVDSFNVTSLRTAANVSSDSKLGSLKLLEAAVATIADTAKAHALMGPLFGIYDLRLSDAHLPQSSLEESYVLAGLDTTASPLKQGVQLISTTMTTLGNLAVIIAPQDTSASRN